VRLSLIGLNFMSFWFKPAHTRSESWPRVRPYFFSLSSPVVVGLRNLAVQHGSPLLVHLLPFSPPSLRPFSTLVWIFRGLGFPFSWKEFKDFGIIGMVPPHAFSVSYGPFSFPLWFFVLSEITTPPWWVFVFFWVFFTSEDPPSFLGNKFFILYMGPQSNAIRVDYPFLVFPVHRAPFPPR